MSSHLLEHATNKCTQIKERRAFAVQTLWTDASVWVYNPLFTYVCVCARASVICSHTCVSQRLHPAAPLSCCHGELPLAYSKCIGVCVRLFMCATSCFVFFVRVCASVRVHVHICMHAWRMQHSLMRAQVCLCPFVRLHMHLVYMRMCLCTAWVSACVLLGARVLCDQASRQMWEQGRDDSQRWWEEEVLVLL